jgi:Tfp pilus assembly protein PilO
VNKRGPNPKIFLILTILTVLAGSALSYMQFTAYGQTKSSVETLKSTAKDPADVQQELDEAIAKLNDTRAKLTHLEMSVPEMEYVPTMLKELEKLGTDCGIQVNGVRPIPRPQAAPSKNENGEVSKKARKPYNELSIEVRGRGNYASVMKFIEGLTTFPKIVAVRTVSLQPKTEANQKPGQAPPSPKLDVTFELRSYLFPADKDKEKKEDAEEAPAEKQIDISGRSKAGVN